MKRELKVLIAGACFMVLLGGGSIAGAETKPQPIKLTGHIKPSGDARVAVSYVRRKGQRFRKTAYAFRRIPVRCNGRRRIAEDSVSGSELIWAKYADRNPFGVTQVDGPFRNPSYKSTVSGKVISRRKARGYVRVSGNSVSLRGGGAAKCDSGRLHWVVQG